MLDIRYANTFYQDIDSDDDYKDTNNVDDIFPWEKDINLELTNIKYSYKYRFKKCCYKLLFVVFIFLLFCMLFINTVEFVIAIKYGDIKKYLSNRIEFCDNIWLNIFVVSILHILILLILFVTSIYYECTIDSHYAISKIREKIKKITWLTILFVNMLSGVWVIYTHYNVPFSCISHWRNNVYTIWVFHLYELYKSVASYCIAIIITIYYIVTNSMRKERKSYLNSQQRSINYDSDHLAVGDT